MNISLLHNKEDKALSVVVDDLDFSVSQVPLSKLSLQKEEETYGGQTRTCKCSKLQRYTTQGAVGKSPQ